MYRYLSTILLSLVLSIRTTEAAPLATQIDELIEKALPHASVGILIEELESGKTLYSKNAKQLRSLASNTKLFTAAAALFRLAPETHFDTRLASDGKNIYITFEGSPNLTEADLAALVKTISIQQPQQQAHIVLDHTRFSPPDYADGISYDDLGWYFTAPSSAIVINENAVPLEWITSKKIGGPVEIHSKIAHPLNLINQITTTTPEEAQHHCSLHVAQLSNNTLRLYGCLAQSNAPRLMSLAIPDPLMYAKEIIRTTLKTMHIRFTGDIIEGKTPKHTSLISKFEGSPLTSMIQHMLQESDNLYADNLTKQLGFLERGRGTYREGVFSIIQILKQHTHLDFNQIKLHDGAGTRYNLATAEQMVILLRDIYRQKATRDLFIQTLPVAGVSGTLQAWGKNTSLEGRVFAKTGSMHDISTLSGYFIRPNKPALVFSILIDHFNFSVSKVRTFQADLLQLVT